ncbi:MAG: hypothetical protein M5U12_33605 [Verrucomicrobia bacterium]|nr:hypothetical protein [Verrucomicrobiota bacterium]
MKAKSKASVTGATAKPSGTVTLPVNRFCAVPAGRLSHSEALAKVREVAGLFERGGEAVTGLYLGLCDLIRTHELEAAEVRPVLLAAGWSKSRASEVLRVAGAPESVWREYSARLVGFKVALQRTRLYRMVGRGSQRYRERMARRAGVRLVQRLDGLPVVEWQLEFGRWRVAAQQLNITNRPISATSTASA